MISHLVGGDAAAAGVVVAVALGAGIDPTSKTANQSAWNNKQYSVEIGRLLGDVTGIAVGGVAVLQGAGARDVARVVHARGAVKGRDVAAARAVQDLRQALAGGGAGGALADHLVDGAGGTGVLLVAVLVAGGLAVVVLHQAGVPHRVVGGAYADAAARLLHNRGQDEAVVDTGGLRGLLDTVPDGALLRVSDCKKTWCK